MKYEIHTLKNGLRVILAPMPEAATATFIIMTGTGSRYENKEENGLAHFLEHMFFKGTKKRPNARIISSELEAIGSVYNAFTSKDQTAYWAKVSKQYLDTAIDVLSDMFLNSVLPAKEITKERGTIIQEIDMYEDMPMRDIGDMFETLVFGAEHPLGRTTIGPKENIRTFSRKDFTEYLKRNYTSDNTVVCVAGSFSTPKVLEKIRREFGRIKRTEQPVLVPFTGTQNEPRVFIKQKKTDQTQLMIGMQSYPYLHKDEYALAVLATILGQGMSSRIFIEVREKRGLAYSVRAWAEKYPDTGYFVVQAGIEHAKVQKVVETVLAEFRKIKRENVSAAELKKAKSFIKGTLAISLETSDGVAGDAASSLVTIGKIRKLEESLRNIDRVTAADIKRVANDILRTEKLNLAIIGPHAQKEKFLPLLHI
ncbi:MAG: pitrilysin family protein [Candidatus Paceibacterota bacterium]|jgi:predicted Zn-dependent peptidase